MGWKKSMGSYEEAVAQAPADAHLLEPVAFGVFPLQDGGFLWMLGNRKGQLLYGGVEATEEACVLAAQMKEDHAKQALRRLEVRP